jgi:hypothetical protein
VREYVEGEFGEQQLVAKPRSVGVYQIAPGVWERSCLSVTVAEFEARLRERVYGAAVH